MDPTAISRSADKALQRHCSTSLVCRLTQRSHEQASPETSSMLTRAAAHARALLRAPTSCQRWARASSVLTGQPGAEELLDTADRETLDASS